MSDQDIPDVDPPSIDWLFEQLFPGKSPEEIDEQLLEPIKAAAARGDRKAAAWLRRHGVAFP